MKEPSRNFDGGQKSSDSSSASRWDFAIAVRPGWHVTVFTSRSLFVSAVILGVVALVAVVWMFSTR